MSAPLQPEQRQVGVAIHGRDHVDDRTHLAIGANLRTARQGVWRKSSRATRWCSVSIDNGHPASRV